MVLHIEVPNFSQFYFEWHEDRQRLYIVDPVTAVAELVSEGIRTQEVATFAVRMWIAGYKTRCFEFGGKHFRMYAEPMKLNFSA